MSRKTKDNFRTVGEMLDAKLTGHGIYEIDLVRDQVTKYGFTYDSDTDRLGYQGRSVRLGSGTPSQLRRSIAQDSEGGLLDQDIPEDMRLVDAIALSEAIFSLYMPGIPPRSQLFINRNRGFRANVDAILRFERSSSTPEH